MIDHGGCESIGRSYGFFFLCLCEEMEQETVMLSWCTECATRFAVTDVAAYLDLPGAHAVAAGVPLTNWTTSVFSLVHKSANEYSWSTRNVDSHQRSHPRKQSAFAASVALTSYFADSQRANIANMLLVAPLVGGYFFVPLIFLSFLFGHFLFFNL